MFMLLNSYYFLFHLFFCLDFIDLLVVCELILKNGEEKNSHSAGQAYCIVANYVTIFIESD